MAPIVCPFVPGMLREETVAALDPYGWLVEWVELDPADDGAYTALIEALWSRRRTVVIVEQDVAPTPGMIERLVACGCAWCHHHYTDDTYGPGAFLGLAKFTGALMAATPAVGLTALRTDRRYTELAHWRTMDSVLARYLTTWGARPHLHQPAVRHLHHEATAGAANS